MAEYRTQQQQTINVDGGQAPSPPPPPPLPPLLANAKSPTPPPVHLPPPTAAKSARNGCGGGGGGGGDHLYVTNAGGATALPNGRAPRVSEGALRRAAASTPAIRPPSPRMMNGTQRASSPTPNRVPTPRSASPRALSTGGSSGSRATTPRSAASPRSAATATNRVPSTFTTRASPPPPSTKMSSNGHCSNGGGGGFANGHVSPPRDKRYVDISYPPSSPGMFEPYQVSERQPLSRGWA